MQWRKSIRDALIPSAIAGLIVGSLAAWALARYGEHLDIHVSFVRAFIPILPVIAVMMIPPVIMSAGPKPQPEDVEVNRALRRAAGMSDEVSTDKPA